MMERRKQCSPRLDLAEARETGELWRTLTALEKDFFWAFQPRPVNHTTSNFFWTKIFHPRKVAEPRRVKCPGGRFPEFFSARFDRRFVAHFSAAFSGKIPGVWMGVCGSRGIPVGSTNSSSSSFFEPAGAIPLRKVPLLQLDMWEHAFLPSTNQ